MNLRQNKTKIVCTIGPATASPEAMHELVRSGMCVARLNMAHGSFDEHRSFIKNLRTASDPGRPLALLLDLPALKYRSGPLEHGRAVLEEGKEIAITARAVIGTRERVSVNSPSFIRDARAGDRILVGDGEITLQVSRVGEDELVCRILVGGILKGDRGLVIPGRSHSAAYVNERMLDQLDFAVEEGLDYLALSLVRGEQDVLNVREVLADRGAVIPLVAKIETAQAVSALDGIIEASDGIMIARGDLGMELPLEQVPVIQKQIIAKCNRLGRPVIVATQMLESMINAPQPTRAEVADVANAAFDGTDAVMLSAETSIGRYPQAAVDMMARVLAETENALPFSGKLAGRVPDLVPEVDDAISFAACHSALQLGARAVIAFTESGSTALRVAKYRPPVPILVFTPNEAVRRRLALVWGVRPYRIDTPRSLEEMFAMATAKTLELGLAKRGEPVVITCGTPIGVTGTTNLLKVQHVE